MLLVLSTVFSYRQAIVPSANRLSVDLTQSRKRWTADSEFADTGVFLMTACKNLTPGRPARPKVRFEETSLFAKDPLDERCFRFRRP
jgi:hypothetical protein